MKKLLFGVLSLVSFFIGRLIFRDTNLTTSKPTKKMANKTLNFCLNGTSISELETNLLNKLTPDGFSSKEVYKVTAFER